jgi:predicted nucleotidyltransferase
MASSWPDFRPTRLLQALTRRGVDFVVIGGLAVIAHGGARVTKDLDICFDRDPANLEALGDVLVRLEARLRGVPDDVPFVPDAATLKRISLLTLDTRHGPLDIHAAPAGSPAYSSLKRRAERVDVAGVVVLVAALEHLMAMKRAAGRAQDLADLEELEAIKRLRRRQRRRARR